MPRILEERKIQISLVDIDLDINMVRGRMYKKCFKGILPNEMNPHFKTLFRRFVLALRKNHFNLVGRVRKVLSDDEYENLMREARMDRSKYDAKGKVIFRSREKQFSVMTTLCGQHNREKIHEFMVTKRTNLAFRLFCESIFPDAVREGLEFYADMIRLFFSIAHWYSTHHSQLLGAPWD